MQPWPLSNRRRRHIHEWFNVGPNRPHAKVCLAVEDEDELDYYLQQVREASLPFALIKDAGLTEVAPGTITVLGVGPGPRHTMDSLFRNLKAYE